MILSVRGFAFESTQGIFTLQYYTIASITVLYYDHIITFPTELRRIWQRRLTLSSVLFLINRYVMFCGYFVVLYLTFDPPDNISLCKHFVRFGGYLSLITQVIIAIILSIRTYALYNRNKWILISAALLGLAIVATSAWALTQFSGILLTFGLDGFGGSVFRSCVPSVIHSSIPFNITFLLSIILDSLIFALTVTRTFQIMREHRRCGMRSQLPGLLMRDGSIYFAVMVVANLVNITLFNDKKLPVTFFEQSTGNSSILSHIISVTMISRIVLNLHAFDGKRHAVSGGQDFCQAVGPKVLANSDANGTEADSNLTQFTTHISRHSTWVFRAEDDFAHDSGLGLGTSNRGADEMHAETATGSSNAAVESAIKSSSSVYSSYSGDGDRNIYPEEADEKDGVVRYSLSDPQPNRRVEECC